MKEILCLYPIKEIDSNWRHPILKKKIDFLINELSKIQGLRLQDCVKSVIIINDK